MPSYVKLTFSLTGKASPCFDPSTYAKYMHLAKEIISARACSFAFEATFQWLALFMLAAAVVVLLIRSSGKKVKGPVH